MTAMTEGRRSGPASSVGGEGASAASMLDRSLPRNAYVTQEFFRRERDAIFFGEWFCAGRVDEIPGPGDFLLLEVVDERILVVRTREGRLSAFYDVCRHRGCRLAIDSEAGPGSDPRPTGRFKGAIRCPYHGWVYGLDGKLRGARFLPEGSCLDDFSLHPVAIDCWGGFVFVNLTPGAIKADLSATLSEVSKRLQRYPLEELRVGERLVYDVRANWKVIAENYNECYHCGPVHPELCQIVPAFRDGGGAGLDWETGVPHREGADTFTRSGTTIRASLPGLSQEEQTRHKGELIYPNLMLSLSRDHVAAFTLWPTASDATTVVCDFLFHPSEVEDPHFDPTDAVEFWDVVNKQDWRICEAVQSGMESRVFESGYYAPMENPSLDIRRYVDSRLKE